MSHLELDARWHTGYVTGRVTAINDEYVDVRGVFIYSNGTDDDPGFEEPWHERYARSAVPESLPVWHQFSDGVVIYDASALPTIIPNF